MGFCDAVVVAHQVITRFPDQWAGLINIRGALPPREPILQQRMRVFYYVPDHKGMVGKEQLAQFQEWAAQLLAPIMRSSSLIDADDNGISGNTEIDRATLLGLAELFMRNEL